MDNARIFKIKRVQELNKEDGGKIHPTQKPVKLYEWILMKYAKEGDKILDTHLGSGSIAIACHNLGYDLTGYEIDKEYFEAAQKRIKEHKSQLRIL
jgi:site-specific DNA-methyltransferase (adenine-specific)